MYVFIEKCICMYVFECIYMCMNVCRYGYLHNDGIMMYGVKVVDYVME